MLIVFIPDAFLLKINKPVKRLSGINKNAAESRGSIVSCFLNVCCQQGGGLLYARSVRLSTQPTGIADIDTVPEHKVIRVVKYLM